MKKILMLFIFCLVCNNLVFSDDNISVGDSYLSKAQEVTYNNRNLAVEIASAFYLRSIAVSLSDKNKKNEDDNFSYSDYLGYKMLDRLTPF